MKKSKANSEHYIWGTNCSGWHLVKSDSVSVIEEQMIPQTRDEALSFRSSTVLLYTYGKGYI